MIPLYKKNSGEFHIFGNLVLDSTTQARLDATQAACTLALRDISDNADEANQTVTLTYQTNGNYSFPMSSINTVMTAGNYYHGTITKAGMLNIEVVFGVISSDRENLTDQQKTDVNNEVIDVMRTDTLSELGVGTPSATPTFSEAIMLLYMALAQSGTSTATTVTIKNSAGTTIASSTITESASQVNKGRFL